MSRYFIEVAYKGTHYSGFQVQQNAVTIQSEIENALTVCFKSTFSLTGASRTDTGVHALQNYFHVDTTEVQIDNPSRLYNLNSILPDDIVIKAIFKVADEAHCRFYAVSRGYKYHIYQQKNPFLKGRAYYFPFTVDKDLLDKAASVMMDFNDFTSFSKKNTQVNNFICQIHKSQWIEEKDQLVYNVEANRFLRGMVKGIVGTMLMVGTKKITLSQFEKIISDRNCSKANFAVSPCGLYLVKVQYPN
ncbi:MAG: tRNA pseudouridine(38-40) synthase TruA [Ginsengibacter sp.]